MVGLWLRSGAGLRWRSGLRANFGDRFYTIIEPERVQREDCKSEAEVRFKNIGGRRWQLHRVSHNWSYIAFICASFDKPAHEIHYSLRLS